MVLKDIDALLITNPTNVRYLTGFVGAAPEEREAYALLTPNKTFLFTSVLYLEQAKKTHATVIEISRENPFARKLGEVLKKGMRLGFEENDLTVAEHHKIRLEHKNVRLIPTQNRIEKLRMIKREEEIESIRAAAKLADQCFDTILRKLTPGITEGEVAWEIEAFIRNNGASLAFSPIVAFGKHTSQPHYSFARHCLASSQGNALRKQDIVLLDFGAKVNGYCSDLTRVVFVGKPKEEWKRAYEAVLAAQRAVFDYLASRPGLEATGNKADRVARTIIEKAGFPPYPHSLGHGVGLDIHEAPRLTMKKDVTLKPGMVFTVEPAIYIEGRYGIRIEDLVILKEHRLELLSKSPKDRLIL